jgi:hypothetical protein
MKGTGIMHKLIGLTAALLIITLLSSCGDIPVYRYDFDSSLNVSFRATPSSQLSVASRVAQSDLTTWDDSLYSAPFNDPATRGNRVYQATPSKFIVPIPEIGFADRFYTGTLTPLDLGHFGAPVLDIINARNFLTTYQISRDRTYNFTVINLRLITTDYLVVGDNDEVSGFSMLSEIHVDLGSDYSGITFANEKVTPYFTPASPDIHVFEMVDLIPLKNDTTSRNGILIHFDREVTEQSVVNPEGEDIQLDTAYFWSPGSGTSYEVFESGYMIYKPGFALDFSGDRELIFNWNITDIIEVYDPNNTPTMYSDDLVTLRLDNPFPITFEVIDAGAAISAPAQTPEDVGLLEIGRWDVRIQAEGGFVEGLEDRVYIALSWINPAQEDFRRVRVIRKAGSAPANVSDGEEIYSGRYPRCIDSSFAPNITYYYRVFVENISGQLSPGVIVNIDS